MAGEKLPRDVLKLIEIYQKAQAKLIETIAQKEARGNVTAYQKSLLKQVDAILVKLTAEAKDWTAEAIPAHYRQGIEQATEELGKLGATVPVSAESFSGLHTSAIELLAANTFDDLYEANQFVGRQVRDQVRQAGLDAIQQKMATGQTVKQAKQNLVRMLVDQGLGGIKDKRGRTMNLASYAEMVARSTTAETTNRAKMNHLTSLGYDLVQMSSLATTCPVCAPLQGRVYSISGKDQRYPPLDRAYGNGYASIHPNCRHRLMPLIEELTDNIEQLREFSNRPFDIDERSQRSIDTYKKIQQDKRRLRDDRRQWERYRLILPEDAPKTLSAFRSMKRANSERWQDMQGMYRYLKKHPESDKIYYKVEKKIAELRNRGAIKILGTAVKPTPLSVKSFNDHALGRMRERGLNQEDSQSFIDGALVAFKQRKGTQYAFYSNQGFTVVTVDGEVGTAGRLDENGEAIMKEVRKIVGGR